MPALSLRVASRTVMPARPSRPARRVREAPKTWPGRRDRSRAAQIVDSRRGAVIAYGSFGNACASRRKAAMKIVERLVGDVVILDLHGKILLGAGASARRDACVKPAVAGKHKH